MDDTKVVCMGLSEMLKNEEDIKIVGFAHNGIEAMEKTALHNPDVILIDLVMPVMGGIEATKKIIKQFSQSKVIILSMSEDEVDILKAAAAGAKGYLLKNISTQDLAGAIRAVNHGFVQLAPGVFDNLAKLASNQIQINTELAANPRDNQKILPVNNQNQIKTIKKKKKSYTNLIVGTIGLIFLSQISLLEPYLAHIGLFLLIIIMAARLIEQRKTLIILTLAIILGHVIKETHYIWETNLAEILFNSSRHWWGMSFGIVSLVMFIFQVSKQKLNKRRQGVYLYLFCLLTLGLAVLHTILVSSEYLGLFLISPADRLRTYTLGFIVLFTVSSLKKQTFKLSLDSEDKRLVSK